MIDNKRRIALLPKKITGPYQLGKKYYQLIEPNATDFELYKVVSTSYFTKYSTKSKYSVKTFKTLCVCVCVCVQVCVCGTEKG